MEKIPLSQLRWLWPPLILFIIFRIGLLIILYMLSGGAEFTSDIWVYYLGLHPLSVVTFATDASLYSQPPLFPIALAPLAMILSRITNEFLASRISYTIIEFTMFVAMAILLIRSDEFKPKAKRAIMTIMALSPLGFMTGTVMRQEEAIVGLFVVLVLIAVRCNRIKWASLAVILGIFTAKIIFGLVFIPLLMKSRNKRQVFYWGIIPALIIAGLYSLTGYLITGKAPFLSFAPTEVQFCASTFRFILYYVWMTGPFMKWLSLGLLAVAFMALWPFLKNTALDDFPILLLLVFCIFFLIFYHVNTEYYIFALPLLAIIPYLPEFKFSRPVFIILHFLFGIVSWGYGIVFGIRIYSEGSSIGSYSKEVALRFYNQYLGFIPMLNFEKCLLLLTLLLVLGLAVISFLHLRQRQGSPQS
jgi:hypothetical protein